MKRDECWTRPPYLCAHIDQASFQIGRVIVATVVDGAAPTAIPPTAGPRSNTAMMMTGYSGNPAEVGRLSLSLFR